MARVGGWDEFHMHFWWGFSWWEGEHDDGGKGRWRRWRWWKEEVGNMGQRKDNIVQVVIDNV